MADNRKFDAHVAAGDAYIAANEKSKAIEAYEKALLVAPDDQSQEATRKKLKEVSGWTDNDWISPAVKKLQTTLGWIVVLIFLIGLLIGVCVAAMRCRYWMRTRSPVKTFRVVISPAGSEFAGYFRDLIQHEYRAIEEQSVLGSEISRLSSATVSPATRMNAILAETAFSLPTELPGKWWSPLASPILDFANPPDYSVKVCLMRTENTCGVSVRLARGREVLHHWQIACDDASFPKTAADLAFKIVAAIQKQ